MNTLRVLAKYPRLSRNFSTTPQCKRTMEEFKEIQRQFQVDDGVPVYLKKGMTDRIIYGCVLLAVGCVLIESARVVKRIIFPAPPSND